MAIGHMLIAGMALLAAGIAAMTGVGCYALVASGQYFAAAFVLPIGAGCVCLMAALAVMVHRSP